MTVGSDFQLCQMRSLRQCVVVVRQCSASVQCVSAVRQFQSISLDYLRLMEMGAQVVFFLTQRDTSIFLKMFFMGWNGSLNRLTFHT